MNSERAKTEYFWMNLVSHSLMRANKISARLMSDSNNPENVKAEQAGVSTSVWKQMRDTSQDLSRVFPSEHPENAQNVDTGKQEKTK